MVIRRFAKGTERQLRIMLSSLIMEEAGMKYY